MHFKWWAVVCLVFSCLASPSLLMNLPENAFEVEQAKEAGCPIRGIDGMYGYDPTSGKGPVEWGSISDEYFNCTSGQRQSPIDFPAKVNLDKMSNGPKLNFAKSQMEIHPVSNNWELRCGSFITEGCGKTTFKGVSYAVHTLRFHRPSEHLLDGKQFPLELHIVHKHIITLDVITISILFDYMNEDDYFSKIASKAYFAIDTNPVVNGILEAVHHGNETTMVDLNNLAKEEYGFCSYHGSFTTPPCTEGVTVFVSTQILKISKRQVHGYWASSGFSFNGNNRPVQPTNGRNVTCFLKKGTMDSMPPPPIMPTPADFNETMTNGTNPNTGNETAVVEL